MKKMKGKSCAMPNMDKHMAQLKKVIKEMMDKEESDDSEMEMEMPVKKKAPKKKK